MFVTEREDGGFLVGATTSGSANRSVSFPYLIRTDALGELLWGRIFSGRELTGRYDSARPTADGGFIFGAETPTADRRNDLYALKLLPVNLSGQPRFVRGDCNADGVLDVTDPIANLSFQFVGTFLPPCRDALDFDDSGGLDVTDPILSLTHQFLGGPPPVAPGKDTCGVDPTDDELSCESFLACPGGG